MAAFWVCWGLGLRNLGFCWFWRGFRVLGRVWGLWFFRVSGRVLQDKRVEGLAFKSCCKSYYKNVSKDYFPGQL